MKVAVVFLIAAFSLTVVSAGIHCAGCQEPLDFQDAKHILNQSLNKLASLEGPYYKSGKINYATQQIIAGIKYRINADLIDVDNKVITCNVIIVKMVASSETEVTFKCPNLEDVTKIY